jgi:hypothetical protein
MHPVRSRHAQSPPEELTHAAMRAGIVDATSRAKNAPLL